MKKLSKAPLQEVIFEIRWQLDTDEATNQSIDKNYEVAVGSLKTLLKPELPSFLRKVPDSVPYQVMPHQTLVQYRKTDNGWPVLQLGPGFSRSTIRKQTMNGTVSFSRSSNRGCTMFMRYMKKTFP